MRRIWHENGLSIVLFLLFLLTLVGQSIAGAREHDAELREHGQAAIGWVAYLTSSDFVEAVFENWESEFLQMGCFVLFTAFLFQKGSPESKPLDEDPCEDEEPEHPELGPAPWPARRGGLVRKLYENSLSLALFTLFVV